MNTRIDEYERLLGLYVQAVQSMAGREFSGSGAWIVESEYLALKLLYHLASILYLSPGTHLRNIAGTDDIHFFDFSSAAVLCRASFETYLTFSYIFVAPCSDDELSLRYLTWSLGGLLDRQSCTPVVEETREFLDAEKTQISVILEEIRQNPAFVALPPKRQKEAIGGQWRLNKAWSDLALMAGKNKKYFSGLYAYLSAYAHSGYLSAVQLGQAEDKQTQSRLGGVYIVIGLTLIGHFLTDYASLFPPVAEVIESRPEDKQLLQVWQGVGENMGGPYGDD